MFKKSITIENANIAITNNYLPHDLIKEFWYEINDYFQNNHLILDYLGDKYRVQIDFSDALDYINKSKNSNLGNKRIERKELNKHPYGSDIIFNYEWQEKQNIEFLDETFCFLTSRLLQKIFIAGNLCLPGSVPAHNIVTKDIDNFKTADLGPHFFERALNIVNENGWPHLQKISFAQTWDWLTDQDFIFLDYAEAPCTKIIFTFLKIGYDETADEDLILSIARALEALFVNGNENCGRLLKERLYLVLGEPEKNKKWISRYYALRSKIAHGDSDMARPNLYDYNDFALDEAYESKNRTDLEIGVAVIISILQDLIANNSTEYIFKQSFSRQ